jgi:cysteinyl-tRNA synthetase
MGRFKKSIEDDFNIPKALGIFWDLVSDFRIKNNNTKEMLKEFDQIFGLGLSDIKNDIIPVEIKELAKKRQIARNNNDWSMADEIRKKIEDGGYTINDGLGNSYDIWKKG